MELDPFADGSLLMEQDAVDEAASAVVAHRESKPDAADFVSGADGSASCDARGDTSEGSENASSNAETEKTLRLQNNLDDHDVKQVLQQQLLSSDLPTTSPGSSCSSAPSIWCNPRASSTPKNNKPSSRPKKDLQECIVSELSGLLPLQLGSEVNPMAKEGFTYTLDAPTSGMVRKGEDPLTYLNKDQFYGLTLEFTPSSGRQCYFPQNVSSVIMLQFRERKEPEEAVAHWEFWQSRQHSPKLRLIDVDAKGDAGVLDEPNEIAHNGVVVYWNPSAGPTHVTVAVRCLSTDFSSQRGVKGIPLHIQIDTYETNQGSVVVDRAFCQIKTFCDKGAERKAREEDRRMSKHNETSGYSLIVQPRSTFQKAFDLVTEPVLYSPKESALSSTKESTSLVSPKQPSALTLESKPFKSEVAASSTKGGHVTLEKPQRATVSSQIKLASSSNPSNNNMQHLASRILIYARQENEEVYTPLHIVPPSVQGLIRAISAKYQIDTVDIRYLFRQTQKGIIVKIDDDMIKYYCNGDVFIMKVLATEEATSGHMFYDVVFSETSSLIRSRHSSLTNAAAGEISTT